MFSRERLEALAVIGRTMIVERRVMSLETPDALPFNIRGALRLVADTVATAFEQRARSERWFSEPSQDPEDAPPVCENCKEREPLPGHPGGFCDECANAPTSETRAKHTLTLL